MHLSARWLIIFCVGVLSGCAVVRTTDITDASMKRHRSIAVLGWPLFVRVSEREPKELEGVSVVEEHTEIRPAELLGDPH